MEQLFTPNTGPEPDLRIQLSDWLVRGYHPFSSIDTRQPPEPCPICGLANCTGVENGKADTQADSAEVSTGQWWVSDDE